MKRLASLFIILSAFTVEAQNVSEKNHKAILGILAKQQKCWNNCDINGYMNFYWNSDSLKFITKSGITMGWKSTYDMYKKHYPDKETMGILLFEEVSMMQMNTKTIFVIGKWTLQKTNDKVGGRFTLIFKKIDGEWEIIIDHTS